MQKRKMNKLPIKLQYLDIELNEEIKCEYLVSSALKKIQLIQLDLLNELIQVCKNHNISFCAFAGTMLGAVRHKGFIPWDDDIDVCMTRENFEKLISVTHEFSHPYFLQTSQSDTRFFCAFARLRNSETTGLLTFNNSAEYNNGIFIDIFVMDGIPDSSTGQKWQRCWLNVIGRFCNSYYKKRSDYVDGVYRISFLTWMSVFLSKWFSRIFPYSLWVALYDKILAWNNKKAERFGLITHGFVNMNKYWMSKDELQDVFYVPFENIEIPISKGYHQVLTRIYKEYMKFPPAEERGKWHQNIVIWEPDMPYVQYIKEHKGTNK